MGFTDMMGNGMVRMMGQGGAGWGAVGLFGWFWILTWTVNSILVGVLLWVLIKKYSKK